MEKHRGISQDPAGNVITSATITVTDYPGGGASTIYSDNAGTALANPFTSSGTDGVYEFYAADGRYTVTAAKTGEETKQSTDVILSDTAYLTRATKAEVAALSLTQYDAGLKVFITSADGGEFTVRYNATLATYNDDGGSYCGTQFRPTGGDGTIGIVRDYSGAINVKWYGAKGDGTTDDYAAINQAITSLATTGGTLWFPLGTYNISDVLYISTNAIMLEGTTVGVNAVTSTSVGSRIVQTTTGKDVVQFGSAEEESDQIVFGGGTRKLILYGQTNANGLHVGYAVHCVFEQMHIDHCNNNVYTQDCWSNSFRNIYSRNATNAGYKLYGRTQNNSFVSCTNIGTSVPATYAFELTHRDVWNIGMTAKYVYSPNHNRFTDCDTSAATYAYAFTGYGGSDNVFENCYDETTSSLYVAHPEHKRFYNNKFVNLFNLSPQAYGVAAFAELTVKNTVIENAIEGNSREHTAKSQKYAFGGDGFLSWPFPDERVGPQGAAYDAPYYWITSTSTWVLDDTQISIAGNGETDTTYYSGPDAIGSRYCAKITQDTGNVVRLINYVDASAKLDRSFYPDTSKYYIYRGMYKHISGNADVYLNLIESYTTRKNSPTADLSNSDFQMLSMILTPTDLSGYTDVMLTAIMTGGSNNNVGYFADLYARKVDLDKEVKTLTSDIILDLSGSADSKAVMVVPENTHVYKMHIMYSEASSADTGVTIEIGLNSDADYFYTGTSEVSKAQYYSADLTLLANDTAKGDVITFSTAGGKTGTGEIQLMIEYILIV